MKVDILWYTGDGLVSSFIKFGQGITPSRAFKRFTHVAIRMGDDLFEAVTDVGICVHTGKSADARQAQSVGSFTISGIEQDDYDRAKQWLWDQVGDKYAFLEILFVALDSLFPWVPLSVALEGTFICSALVAFALLILGIEKLNKYDPRLETPSSLAAAFLT